MPLAGILCEYGFSEGWDSVFYIIGITSTITIVLWLLITSNTPASHPRISKREREFIMNSLKGEIVEHSPTLCEMPWRKILTSGPVWALIIANFCVDWGLYTYLTNIPTFFSEVLFFDIKSNGMFSALPFLGLWATCQFVPMIADKLRAAGIMSTANVRKLFNTIGMIGAAVILIGLSYIDCSQKGLAVTLLVLAVAISGCVYSGYYVNHMDIAPQYADTLMGIANGIAAASGFIAPYIASVITKPQTRESWQIVFFIAAAVYTFGAVMYCILGRGTLQPWAHDLSHDIYEIEPMQVKPNGFNGFTVEGVDRPPEGPIYKPKSAANGNAATDHMLESSKL
jgi:ACS family sodium-dependent inorganic phosphate cotransporter-like MFS transporter 5